MTAPQDEPTDGLDVTRLVGRAADGDGWAWERLVDQYEKLIWAITRDFKVGESDAADVAQATWLRLLEYIDRLEQPDRVGSWLAVTARHECVRNLAARKGPCRWPATPCRKSPRTGQRSTRACSPPNSPRPFARLCPACRRAGRNCLTCSWPTRQPPTPRYPTGLASRSAVSAPPASDASPSYAACFTQKELSQLSHWHHGRNRRPGPAPVRPSSRRQISDSWCGYHP